MKKIWEFIIIKCRQSIVESSFRKINDVKYVWRKVFVIILSHQIYFKRMVWFLRNDCERRESERKKQNKKKIALNKFSIVSWVFFSPLPWITTSNFWSLVSTNNLVSISVVIIVTPCIHGKWQQFRIVCTLRATGILFRMIANGTRSKYQLIQNLVN